MHAVFPKVLVRPLYRRKLKIIRFNFFEHATQNEKSDIKLGVKQLSTLLKKFINAIR